MARVLRKRLDHATHFGGRFGAIYFVTICCQQRGRNQLCDEGTAKILFDTARIYHERARWNMDLLLLMPDHLHALIAIDGRDSLSQMIRDYKRITAKLGRIEWQRKFFDHRLRISYRKTENPRNASEVDHPAIRACFQKVGIDEGAELHHMADLPARTGLGSSSSFVVAMLQAVGT